MRKLQIYSAIGRGRPIKPFACLNYTTYPCSQFHSSPHSSASQEAARDGGIPAPSPRASRLRASASEIQTIYKQSPSASPSTPPPAGISIEEALSRPQPQAIDARSLAASPSNAPRFSIRRRPRPDDGDSSFLNNPQPPPASDQGFRIHRHMYDSEKKDNRPRGTEPRSARQEGAPPRREGSGPRRGAGGARGDGGKTRGPRRRQKPELSSSASAQTGPLTADDWTEAELAYRAHRQWEKAPKPVAFSAEWVDEGKEGFAGFGPGIVSGEWGMRQIAVEKGREVEAVLGLKGGKAWGNVWVGWESERGRREGVGFVEGVVGGATAGEAGGEGKVLERLFGGYEVVGGEGVMGDAAVVVGGNQSFRREDREGLIGVVGRVVLGKGGPRVEGRRSETAN